MVSANTATLLTRAHVEFSGRDLQNIRIPGADLSAGILDSTNLSGAFLDGVDLCQAFLNGANFKNCSMKDVNVGVLPYLEVPLEPTTIVMSRDETILAVVSEKQITIIDLPNRKLIQTINSDSKINGCDIDPTNKLIAFGCEDHKVYIWNLQEKKEEHQLVGHTGNVYSVAFDHTGKFLGSGGSDRKAKVWNLSNFQMECEFSEELWCCYFVGFDPEGKYFYYGGVAIFIVTWSDRKPLGTIHVNARLAYLTFSENNTIAAVSGFAAFNYSVRIISIEEKKEIVGLTGHTESTTGVTFITEKIVGSSSDDGTIRIWDIPSRGEISSLKGHTGKVTGLAYSRKGGVLISSGNDKTIRFWKLEDCLKARQHIGHNYAISTLAFSPKENILCTASYDSTLRVWNMESKKSFYSSSDQLNHASAVAFDTISGKNLAIGRQTKFYYVCDILENPKQESFPLKIPKKISSIVFNSSSHIFIGCGDVLSSSGNQILMKMLLSENFSEIQLPFDENDVYTMATPNYNLRRSIYSMALHPGGEILAIGSAVGILIWSIAKKDIIYMMDNSTTVDTISFDKTGKYFVTNAPFEKINVWNFNLNSDEKVTLKTTLQGHTNVVTSLAHDSTGKFFASGSSDRTIKIWNSESLREITTIKSQLTLAKLTWNSASNSMGNLLAAGGGDGDVLVWKCEGDSGKVWQLIFRISKSPLFYALNSNFEGSLMSSKLKKIFKQNGGIVGEDKDESEDEVEEENVKKARKGGDQKGKEKKGGKKKEGKKEKKQKGEKREKKKGKGEEEDKKCSMM